MQKKNKGGRRRRCSPGAGARTTVMRRFGCLVSTGGGAMDRDVDD
jgi:hypothetical protein